MRIRVSHQTAYAYERSAKSIVQVLRMTPRSHEGQHVARWRLEINVDGRLRAGEDALGNITHMLSVEGPLDHLTLSVSGEVETADSHGVVAGTIERFPGSVYLRETPLTQASDELTSFARDAAGRSRRGGLEVAHRLMIAVHREIAFDTEPTNSGTTAAQAFGMRRGVCQDLTHIFIAAARHIGIPARYVSGYFVRADGIVVQEAGHAWAEALIPDFGWVGFDAANGISPTDAHLRVAMGLDYLGAAPIRGSRYGGGSERLNVALTVAAAMRQDQA